MILPSIKITLPLLFALWLVGAYLANMTALWAYPAMWAAVAAVFFGLHLATSGKSTPVSASNSQSAES